VGESGHVSTASHTRSRHPNGVDHTTLRFWTASASACFISSSICLRGQAVTVRLRLSLQSQSSFDPLKQFNAALRPATSCSTLNGSNRTC
jgi:hypothetical protein